MDRVSLSKLNVAKLKEKCKELKITGYSKLPKPLLIEKLLAIAPSVNSGAGDSGKGTEPRAGAPPGLASTDLPLNVISHSLPVGSEQAREISGTQPEDATVESVGTKKKRARKNKGNEEPAKKKTKKTVTAITDDSPPASNSDRPILGIPLGDIQNDTPGDAIQESHKNPRPSGTSNEALPSNPKDKALAPPEPTPINIQATKPVPPTPVIVPRQPKSQPSQGLHSHTPGPYHSTNQTQNKDSAPQTQAPAPPRKPETYKPKTFKPPAILRPPRANPPKPVAPESASCTEQSLDFPSPELCTYFPSISMPPSTARRRQAERMSVIFSGIADAGVLGLCAKVSRAWRYAVYLSATHTLCRDYAGARLESIRLQIKEPRMTNMWAYLRARRLETSTRYKAFQGSWLGRFFATEMSGHDPVSWRIWNSADDDCQITVALRFISTRVVFSLARRYNECDQTWINLSEKVIEAEQIVTGEIWKVTTMSPGGQLRSYHILYDTGEVIGLAPPPRCGIIGYRIKHRPHIEVLDSEPGVLRADWREYILLAGSGPNLQDTITGADRDSYIAGVSTFWLRSLGLEDEGSIRKTIARRYILSCVEPNSVSGEYKSVIDMAGDVVGVATHNANRKSRRQVGLFISEHHLVESVHIPSSLHPALAMVVTTPGREYFVLQDTGTPIGTSDQGLEPLWQRLIGCDAWGNRCAYTARAIG